MARRFWAGRLHRPHDPLHPNDWPRRPLGGGVPTLRGGAGGHGPDGRRRQRRTTPKPDADGRPGGLPGEPHRGEQAGGQQTH